MDVQVLHQVDLGRYVPDRTRLELCAFAPLADRLGVVTVPFVVYGEEQVKRLKPAFTIEPDGGIVRRVVPGLDPEATLIGQDAHGTVIAWQDANRTALLAVGVDGKPLWRHRLSGRGCARFDAGGVLVIGSVAGELRRVDRSGALLHDFDAIFPGRPFSGPHGVDLDGPATFFADPDSSHAVWALDGMGNATRRIGSPDPDANRHGRGLLYYPCDLVALAGGTIWVAEDGRHRLAAFDAQGGSLGQVTSADLGAETICTSRIFADLQRRELFVFARREREVWLIGFAPAP